MGAIQVADWGVGGCGVPSEAAVLKLLNWCSLPPSGWDRTASAKTHRPTGGCAKALSVRTEPGHLGDRAEASQALSLGKVGHGWWGPTEQSPYIAVPVPFKPCPTRGDGQICYSRGSFSKFLSCKMGRAVWRHGCLVDKAQCRCSAPPLSLQDEAHVVLASFDDVIFLKARSRVLAAVWQKQLLSQP